MPESGKEILTVGDVAELFDVEPERISQWVERRMIPCFHLDEIVRFRRSTLLEWVAGLERSNADNIPLLASGLDGSGATIVDRLDRALERLRSSQRDERLVGIYALQRMAEESDTDPHPLVAILENFARLVFPQRTDQNEQSGNEQSGTAISSSLQPVLSALVGFKLKHWHHVDLRDLDLSGADLRGADLGHVILVNARLDRALLDGVILESTLPTGESRRCPLQGVSLEGASLQKARLGQARLYAANLKRANFTDAILDGADLEGADLTDAILTRASLSGAKLAGAKGLTKAQLESAVLDSETTLPDHLRGHVTLPTRILPEEQGASVEEATKALGSAGADEGS